jgi:hypothetical protein
MVLGIKHGQNSKPNKREIIMKKDYSRLNLPDLLSTSTGSENNEEPTVTDAVVVEAVVVEAVVVTDDSEKDSKKNKSRKWSDVIAGEPEEVAQVSAE